MEATLAFSYTLQQTFGKKIADVYCNLTNVDVV